MKTNVSSTLPDTELEVYIQDWHYDDASHQFARKMGSFLFQFKVSDSKYALASYRATWRKLEKYIDSLGYDK
jgi:hypothetical protein